MIDNLPERRMVGGEVDFTMMYAAHDAFARHLDRIADLLGHGDSRVVAAWEMFAKQLHTHHTAEDESLWPVLRAAIASPAELAVLEAMEAEHAQLDPAVNRIQAQLTAGHGSDAADSVRELATGLARHMRHEENDALPLIDAYLGKAGWAAFGQRIRAAQGVSGAAEYLPWVLDGAPAAVVKKVLSVLPAPVRIVYATVWVRRYRARSGS